jgi:hypothetical protein
MYQDLTEARSSPRMVTEMVLRWMKDYRNGNHRARGVSSRRWLGIAKIVIAGSPNMRIESVNRTPEKPGAEKSGGTATTQAEALEQLGLQVQSGNYDVSTETIAHALIEAHVQK